MLLVNFYYMKKYEKWPVLLERRKVYEVSILQFWQHLGDLRGALQYIAKQPEHNRGICMLDNKEHFKYTHLHCAICGTNEKEYKNKRN